MNVVAEVTYAQAIDQALREEMARDITVTLIGPEIDMVDQGGFDTERNVVASLSGSPLAGIALGSALMGMRLVVMLQDQDALADAFSQIAEVAARLHWRSGGDLYAPLVLRVPLATQTRNVYWRSSSPEAGLARVILSSLILYHDRRQANDSMTLHHIGAMLYWELSAVSTASFDIDRQPGRRSPLWKLLLMTSCISIA